MIIGIHQLHYLPWLRYIHKIASCDVFVILDNIQFNKNGWQNRNKVKSPQGTLTLTVPVLHKHAQSLSEVHIDSKQPWARKHWGTLLNNYKKAPFFKDYEPFLKGIYEKKWTRFNDLSHEMLSYFVKTMGIKTKMLSSSDLSLKGEATERLVNICKDLGADTYLTGQYATEVYLEKEPFEREKIQLIYQSFEAPQYDQLFPDAGFFPELSIVDLLFNCGPRSLEILMRGTILQAQGHRK